jgi:hypothetical protein
MALEDSLGHRVQTHVQRCLAVSIDSYFHVRPERGCERNLELFIPIEFSMGGPFAIQHLVCGIIGESVVIHVGIVIRDSNTSRLSRVQRAGHLLRNYGVLLGVTNRISTNNILSTRIAETPFDYTCMLISEE